MLLNRTGNKRKSAAGGAGRTAGLRKLYSVPVWMSDRIFAGEFEIDGRRYGLSFIPARAEAAGGKLRLHGRLIVSDGSAGVREIKEIGATLASIQGGMGRGPARHKLLAAESTEASPNRGLLPATEYTGPTSFTAAMFFHLDALDASVFHVPADMSHVQLNVRLAPKDPTAQTLHSLYSALVDTVAGEPPNPGVAAALIKELNQILAG